MPCVGCSNRALCGLAHIGSLLDICSSPLPPPPPPPSALSLDEQWRTSLRRYWKHAALLPAPVSSQWCPSPGLRPARLPGVASRVSNALTFVQILSVARQFHRSPGHFRPRAGPFSKLSCQIRGRVRSGGSFAEHKRAECRSSHKQSLANSALTTSASHYHRSHSGLQGATQIPQQSTMNKSNPACAHCKHAGLMYVTCLAETNLHAVIFIETAPARGSVFDDCINLIMRAWRSLIRKSSLFCRWQLSPLVLRSTPSSTPRPPPTGCALAALLAAVPFGP